MRAIAFSIIFLSLLFTGNAAEITQNIRGRITDVGNLQPLPGANIIVTDSDPFKGASSDVDGYFEIKDVPVGRLNLKVSYVGYKDVYLSEINHIAGKETYIEIEMQEFLLQGKEVIVRANQSKAGSINQLTSISARGFTVEETERFAGSRNDVARMASNYAGVVGLNDSRNDIVVRGNSPLGLSWRLEGVDIPSPNHWAAFGSSGGPVNMLNNNLLADSDFLSGAFPAEYGNAFASVFDLRMRNGNNHTHEFLGQVGFNGFELGAEGPFLKDHKGSYLTNVRYSTMEVFDRLGVNFGTSGVPQYSDMSFKINLPATSAGSFSLFGLGGRSRIELLNSNREDMETTDYYTGEGTDLINGANMIVTGLNHLVSLTKDIYVRSTVAYSYRNNFTQLDSIVLPEYTNFNIYGNDYSENRLSGVFSLNAKINRKNLLKAGMNISNRMLYLSDSAYSHRFSQRVTLRDMEGSGWLLQPFTHWQFKPNEALEINAGLHYQHFLMNDTYSLEPRLGLSYDLSNRHRLSFGAGRHSQILPVNIYHTQSYTGSQYVKPNLNLEMLKSDHYVLGYDFRFNPHTRMKIETYYQRLFDVPINGNEQDSYSMLNQGANFGVFTTDTLVNEGSGKNIGVELTLERFFHQGFYYLFTASVFDSKYRGSDNKWRNTTFNNNYIGNLLAGYEWKVGENPKRKSVIDINIKTTYAGGQRFVPFNTVYNPDTDLYNQVFDHTNAFAERYRDYFRADLSIGFKMNTGAITQEWMLEITNLFNNQNIFNTGFNRENGEEFFNYQLGTMVIPQWRIRF